LTVADVDEVNVRVIVPSFPVGGPGLLVNGHEMHWPPVYLSSVAVKTFAVTGPDARYHWAAPVAWYE
jgi:hypothetical protein